MNDAFYGALVEATLYLGEESRQWAAFAECTLSGEPVEYFTNGNRSDPIFRWTDTMCNWVFWNRDKSSLVSAEALKLTLRNYEVEKYYFSVI